MVKCIFGKFRCVAVIVMLLAGTASANWVTVDDFNDGSIDTSLWDVNVDSDYKASEENGELELRGYANGDILQKDEYIPLPTNNGYYLTVEFALRSDEDPPPTNLTTIFQSYDSSGQVGGWSSGVQTTGDPTSYKARKPQGGYNNTDVAAYGTEYDVYQGIYTLTTGGVKKFSSRVMKAGDSAWTTLTTEEEVNWNDDGQGNTVSQLGYRVSTEYAAGRVYTDYVRYKVVPEPATIGLLCLGAIGLLRRRK